MLINFSKKEPLKCSAKTLGAKEGVLPPLAERLRSSYKKILADYIIFVKIFLFTFFYNLGKNAWVLFCNLRKDFTIQDDFFFLQSAYEFTV